MNSNLLSYGSTTLTWDYHNSLTQSVTQNGGSGGSIATATPAFVQGGLNSTSSSVTFSTPVATGNLILVGLTNWNTAIPAGSITDNKGNTYTKVAEVINTTADHLALFYAKNVSGGSSFTVTSSADGTISAHEYSGISTSSPLDKVASSTGSSGTSLSSGNVTPAVAGELIFGLAWSELDGSSWTAGTGYTLRTQETNNATAERSASEDRIATNTNAIATTFTVGGSAPWTALIATFKPLVTVTGGTSTPSATSTYRYDQSGNRVQLTDTGSTGTTTSYWGSTYQQTPGGYKKTKNIYVNGQLVATLEKTGTNTMIPYYIATDHLGGTSVVTNSSGVATETLDYFPYGGVRVDAKAGGVNQARKYIGQNYDDATSLSYLNARYYDGTRGQFLSQDPIFTRNPNTQHLSSPQLLNAYSYAANNPINSSDPTGEDLTVSQVIALSKGGTLSPSQASSLASGGTVYGVTNTTPWSYISSGGSSGGSVSTPTVVYGPAYPASAPPASPIASVNGGGSISTARATTNVNGLLFVGQSLALTGTGAVLEEAPNPLLKLGGLILVGVGIIGLTGYIYSQNDAPKGLPPGAMDIDTYRDKYNRDLPIHKIKGDLKGTGGADNVYVVRPGYEGAGDIYIDEGGQATPAGNVEGYQ